MKDVVIWKQKEVVSIVQSFYVMALVSDQIPVRVEFVECQRRRPSNPRSDAETH